MCRSKSQSTPHCVTIHSTGVDSRIVVSVCTGTVVKFDGSEDPRWIDSLNQHRTFGTYSSVVSEFVRLTPFLKYINPTRAGLTSTYISQAVCTPCCVYDPTRVVVPLYSSLPLMIPEDIGTRDPRAYLSLPGNNLFAVFCNTSLTYKDGMVMSDKAASTFRYFCAKTINLTANAVTMSVGARVLPFSQS